MTEVTYSQLYPSSDADRALIREAVTHASIWKAVADDLTPPPEAWEPVNAGSAIYLGCFAADLYLGVIAFYQQNSVTTEVHTCLLPVAWGSAVHIGRGACEWIWTNTAFCRIITSVPESNRLALRLAEGVGFTRYGVNERSWLKDRKLQGQVCLGLSKPEGYTCQ